MISYTISMLKQTGKPNIKAESDLVKMIQKWANRKGFGKVEFTRE